MPNSQTFKLSNYHMQYKRMPIEEESPEELGYGNIEINLAESSMRDRKLSEIGANLDELVLNYGDHRGLPELRKLICEKSQQIGIEHVLVCQAAAMALFIVNTSLLSSTDHLIVIRPNYATNIETPRAIGCEISIVDLSFENGFQLDIELIANQIKSNTKLISITTPHNPTGVVFLDTDLLKLAKFTEKKGIYLLVDETYRELNFQTAAKPYFAELNKNIISISSMSKAYGLPGLRLGWLICQDKEIMNLFLAAKEQIIITNGIIDEYLAQKALEKKEYFLLESHEILRGNFEIVKLWLLNHAYLEWIEQAAGAVGFVRFKAEYGIDYQLFYQILFDKYKTIVGPGHWFEMPDQYFRLGFGFPTRQELINGLNAIDSCIELLLD